jgi:hypothetical protein
MTAGLTSATFACPPTRAACRSKRCWPNRAWRCSRPTTGWPGRTRLASLTSPMSISSKIPARCPNGMTSPPKCGPGAVAARPSSARSRRNSSSWPRVTHRLAAAVHRGLLHSSQRRVQPRQRHLAQSGVPGLGRHPAQPAHPGLRRHRRGPPAGRQPGRTGPGLTLRAADTSPDRAGYHRQRDRYWTLRAAGRIVKARPAGRPLLSEGNC